jgi:transposase
MMIHVSDQSRYLLFCGETDMRKSFHGLSALVKYHMKCDVQNGDVYVFISRRRSSIKLLRFEGDGFAIFYKHLEKGTFEMPKQEGQADRMLISDNDLLFMLKGVALKRIKYRSRYSHHANTC